MAGVLVGVGSPGVTVGALVAATTHTRPPPVTGFATEDDLQREVSSTEAFGRIIFGRKDVGILSTFQDQVTIKKGKIWRMHYWVLKKRDILRLSTLKDEVKRVDKYNIYQEMTDDMWVHDEKE